MPTGRQRATKSLLKCNDRERVIRLSGEEIRVVKQNENLKSTSILFIIT
jgi:hypothetical protein